MEKLTNIKISTSQIQKVTNSIGNELINKEEDLIEKGVKYEEKKNNIDKIAISMDGAMINTYEEWKEVFDSYLSFTLCLYMNLYIVQLKR